MILIAASASVRKAFHIVPVDVSPIVPTNEWFRFWRVDARYIDGYGELALFTNHETLYSFIVDANRIAGWHELMSYFMMRYAELFRRYVGYTDPMSEQIAVHRGSTEATLL
jgi:hypothetical protein